MFEGTEANIRYEAQKEKIYNEGSWEIQIPTEYTTSLKSAVERPRIVDSRVRFLQILPDRPRQRRTVYFFPPRGGATQFIPTARAQAQLKSGGVRQPGVEWRILANINRKLMGRASIEGDILNRG